MWRRIGLLAIAGFMAISATVISAPALADDAPANVTDVQAAPDVPAEPESTPQELPKTEPEATPAPEPPVEPAVADVRAAAAEASVTTNAVLRGAPSGIVVMAAISGLSFTPTDPLPGGAITVTGNGCDPSEDVLIRTFSTTLGDTAIDVVTPADAGGSFSIPTRVWGAPGDLVAAAGGEEIGVAAYCGGVETADPDRRQIVYGTMATPVGGPVPPVANPDTAHAQFETPITIDVLANDTGDGIHVVGGTNGADGDVVWAADGSSITYTPRAGFVGTDTFGYSIQDSARLSAISTVTVTVAANELPRGFDDSYSTAYETPLTVSAPGLLTNDTDAEGDALRAVELAGGGPTHGVLSNFMPDGSFTYTPDDGFEGTDTFHYFAYDGIGLSADTTATITVNALVTGSGTDPSGDGADDRALPDTGAPAATELTLLGMLLLTAGIWLLRRSRRPSV